MDKNNIYRKLREETETNETPELTQTELADIFASEGNPISQSVISKLEKSKKKSTYYICKCYQGIRRAFQRNS